MQSGIVVEVVCFWKQLARDLRRLLCDRFGRLCDRFGRLCLLPHGMI
jgi:hypothetical protein